MIHDKGNLRPSLEQVAHACRTADDSFCQKSKPEFNVDIPKIDGFEYAGDAVLLRLRNVEPHNDPWVSNGNDPRVRRAVFWLLHISGGKNQNRGYNQTKLDDVWLGCGKDKIKMRVGDWVLFDDSKDHWVMSDHIWRGASWQLRKERL